MPRVFLILAACYAIMQFVGLLCISEPTEEELKSLSSNEKQQLLDGEEQSSVEVPVTKSKTPAEEGLTTCRTLQTPKFWQIWFTLLFISMVNVFISSFYKVIITINYPTSFLVPPSSQMTFSSFLLVRYLLSVMVYVVLSGAGLYECQWKSHI